MYVGKDPDNTLSMFRGNIKELIVFNRYISDAEEDLVYSNN